MKKIVFCILILWCALLVGSVSAEREIVIGAIIDERGDSASFAKGIEAAVNLAAADMNEYYAKTGKNITVIIRKAGTDGSKEAAAQAARDLINQGVQIIVGPTTSEEVSGYLPIITNEGILSISPSTSIKLSLPGDAVVRLCPDDYHILQALESFNTDFKGMINPMTIVVSRGDIYGINLADLVSSVTNVTGIVSYPPNTQDFTRTLDELDSLVTPVIEEYGEESVCIFAISMDEITDLMAQASAYPNLKKIHWSGMDGVALNPTVLENETAAEFADATGLAALSFDASQVASSDYWRVHETVQAAIGGRQPHIYEILPYDETVMATRIVEHNMSGIQDNLYLADYLGKTSYGATGRLKLNENGDREFGDYCFYQMRKGDDGKYTWVPSFTYLYGMDTTIPLVDLNSTTM